MAALTGGGVVAATTAGALSATTSRMKHLTLRNEGATKVVFGTSNLNSSSATTICGYLSQNESYTWGPFEAGGVVPSEIYTQVTSGTSQAYWNAVKL